MATQSPASTGGQQQQHCSVTESTPSASPGPGRWHLQTPQKPVSPEPLEAPWTDSHPQHTSIPPTVLLFPPLPDPPNIEVCFEVETLSRPY